MQDQTSWKSQTFTLLVFAGIVVLCSIFFILGMLVGRNQGQKLAFAATASAAARADAKLVPKEEIRPDLTFYDSVKQSDSPSLEPVVPDTSKTVEREPSALRGPEKILNYQIGAVRKSGDADKLLDQVKKKGFKAFIIAPSPDEVNPFFRIQVGPFADMIEADAAKRKLESAGYQPILKK
jgi:cell division septation protein DedD